MFSPTMSAVYLFQVRQQSLAGTTPRPLLPPLASQQLVCNRSPSRLLRLEPRARARARTRPSRRRIKPSSTPLCLLATDTLVTKLFFSAHVETCFSIHFFCLIVSMERILTLFVKGLLCNILIFLEENVSPNDYIFDYK